LTGEDWSYIAKLLKIQKLPEGIRDYLNANQEPEIIEHFNLRQLLEIVRLKDEKAQFERFQEMISEVRPLC